MNLLALLSFYLISSNAILLVIFKIGFRKKIEDNILLLFSCGAAPFIVSLLFYASVILFPGKNDLFYQIFIVSLFLFLFYFLRIKISDLKDIYLSLLKKFNFLLKIIPLYVIVPAVFFIILYSLQLLAYPIVDNDSAVYLNQSQAVYEYKNMDWQKKPEIKINGNDNFTYDFSVRPGVPMLIAFNETFLSKTTGKYISFSFLIFYYYVLLLFLFLFIIKKVSRDNNIPIQRSLCYGLLFFVFSWGLSRSVISSSKEIIVYFFALFSIYIASILISEKNKNENQLYLLTILGVLLGINSFINLHGIIIEAVIIFILFLLFKKKFIDRLKKIIYVILLSFPSSGFETLICFNFIFSTPLTSLLAWFNKIILAVSKFFVYKNLIGSSGDLSNSGNVSSLTTSHQGLYQFNNILDEYLKGKLQILTNVGSFGLNFWIYLIIVFKFFKSILKNNLLKFLVFFIAVYYLLVIDPFNMIDHPMMVILSGSPKYSMLLIFLSIIPISIFMDLMIQKIIDFTEAHNIKIFISISLFTFIVFYFKGIIIEFGLKILLSTIPIYKDISFYKGIIEKNFYVMFFVLLISAIIILIFKISKEKKCLSYLFNFLLTVVVIVPFISTNVGKFPLTKTFEYIKKDAQFKLENNMFGGDIFKVYFQAKEKFSPGTIVGVDHYELYTYDNYFSLRYKIVNNSANYLISESCEEEKWKILASSNRIYLCERKQ